MSKKFSFKFLEIFQSLKSDAVPRPPRPDHSFSSSEIPPTETCKENVNSSYAHNESSSKKPFKKEKKHKKSFFTNSPENSSEFEENIQNNGASSNINTQASGNVINIVNSKNVRCGNEVIYYMGPVQGQHRHSKVSTSDDEDDPIKKDNLIEQLLKAENKPEHEYMDYISKNLGKGWHSLFRRLGYKQGQIETAEIDMAKYGVAEARYKLLLDWVRNDDDGTLGKLADVLWEDGQRQMVKELASLYNTKK